MSRSSVKRYAKLAEQGRPLAPKKRPGSKPKMDERTKGGSWRPMWRGTLRPPSLRGESSFRRRQEFG